MVAMHMPGPKLIQTECQEIRQAWTQAECRRRAENALRRQAELLELLGEPEADRGLDAPHEGQLAVTSV